MKKIFTILFFSFLLTNNVFAVKKKADNYKAGKRPLKLTQETANWLEYFFSGGKMGVYKKKQKNMWKPGLIAISIDGREHSFFRHPWNIDHIDNTNYAGLAISKCKKRSGTECYLFANGYKIVWDNGSDKKKRRLKKRDIKAGKTLQILQELGFYDGSSYQSKADDNYDYPSLIASLSKNHKESWKDYVLGGNEKYKAWVMVKRNDGDMSWGFEANNNSWDDVIKRALDRCTKYIKDKPSEYSLNSICTLYYKGTTPTTDNEKLKAAKDYYGNNKAIKFFKENPNIFNDPSVLPKNKKVSESTKIDIVDRIKELNELYKSGVLTKEEFEKAKKKILN